MNILSWIYFFAVHVVYFWSTRGTFSFVKLRRFQPRPLTISLMNSHLKASKSKGPLKKDKRYFVLDIAKASDKVLKKTF